MSTHVSRYAIGVYLLITVLFLNGGLVVPQKLLQDILVVDALLKVTTALPERRWIPTQLFVLFVKD